jgi:ribose transport system substrate-binding protein
LAGALKEANAAKIPVVAYDQDISGGELAAYLTSDNYQAGYLDGEYLASILPKGGKCGIILVEYPHVSSTVEREDGFIDALDAARLDYKILKTYTAVEPKGGQKALKAILEDFPEKGSVDAVFMVNDGGGRSIIEGLLAAGRDEMIFASIDGDPGVLKLIAEGRMKGVDSAQFCGTLGAEAMKAAYSILSGKPFFKRALVPVFPVTKETISLYPGWCGPPPESFRKPWPSKNPVWRGLLKETAE